MFPGLAVAQMLKDRGHEVLLLVSEKPIDQQALQSHPEFRAEKLPSVGLPSILSPAIVRFLGRTWESMSLCKEIYRKFRPDAVLGMGGFTSTAPLLAGRLGGIATCVHESNAIPGKANKLASHFVDNVLLGFDDCSRHFPGKTISVTGTPVRKDLGDRMSREEALAGFKLDPARRTLLVMGGSQGASGLNQLLFKAAPLMKEAGLQIIHLTGERDDRLAAANYLREEIPYYVSPFHQQMCEAYSAADLVVSRAGAASLSELASFELPSLLIPYPFAAENHQEMNAQIFVDAGASELFIESATQPDVLARRVVALLGDPDALAKMAGAARKFSPREAAGKVADAVEEAIERRK